MNTPFEFPKQSFYLFSYPRSGNTWLILSLEMLLHAARAEARSEFDLWTHVYGEKGADTFWLKTEDALDMERPLIIKSHETYDAYKTLYPKNKCVYIYRDGRDVMLSYYFYTKIFANKEKVVIEAVGDKQVLEARTTDAVNFDETEFADFLNQHVLEWAKHVNGWLNAPNAYILTYEGLHQDFKGKLTEIVDYLKIKPYVDVSEVEQDYVNSFKELFTGDNRRFFRKGVVGDWKNYFTENHVKIFSDLTKNLKYVSS